MKYSVIKKSKSRFSRCKEKSKKNKVNRYSKNKIKKKRRTIKSSPRKSFSLQKHLTLYSHPVCGGSYITGLQKRSITPNKIKTCRRNTNLKRRIQQKITGVSLKNNDNKQNYKFAKRVRVCNKNNAKKKKNKTIVYRGGDPNREKADRIENLSCFSEYYFPNMQDNIQDENTIKRKWMEMSLKYHPDKFKVDKFKVDTIKEDPILKRTEYENHFSKLNECYRKIKDLQEIKKKEDKKEDIDKWIYEETIKPTEFNETILKKESKKKKTNKMPSILKKNKTK